MAKRWYLILGVVVVTLLSTATTASAAPASVPPIPAQGGRLVVAALGDSFSSGVGTRVYDPTSGSCQRSPLAYPPLVARLRHEALAFLACSGATTDSVIASQVPTLPAAASLVTITVGGDDAGFTTVLTSCSDGTPDACAAAIAAGLVIVRDVLPGKLAVTYAAIRAHTPQARQVVLGYPHLFGSGSCTAPGLPPATTRAAIDAGTDALDIAIQQVAAASGAEFVDVRSRFQDHGTCAAVLRRWINPPTKPVAESYHPNALGHALGYLPALLAATSD
jgi:hypothetical protein